MWAKIPRIDEWEVLKSGAIKGIIADHPVLPDGYEITTSPLDEKSVLKPNAMVKTSSGSKYKLLQQLPPKATTQKNRPTLSMFGGGKEKEEKASPPPKQNQKQKQKQAAKAKAAPAYRLGQDEPQGQASKEVDYDYVIDLNGKVVGSKQNEYLLVGKLIPSSSKRSQIYYAYKADKDGNPSGTKLTVKLTASKERLSRETKNYDRVFSKGRVLFSLEGSNSCFVKKIGFCPDVDSYKATTGIPSGSSALILEAGDRNLRAYLGSTTRGGLTGSDLRRAAVNVCRCVEAMHSSGLVWTDLKAENFVLIGKNQDVKGIDLESAVPAKASPEDYSPEACPPEFAVEEKAGRGYEFAVEKNYDSWSLGMLFFELATGSNYFKGKSEGAILSLLATGAVLDETKTTVRDLDKIDNKDFRDLTKQCLSIDPKKRPSITQILLHPYFLTTGLGPLTF